MPRTQIAIRSRLYSGRQAVALTYKYVNSGSAYVVNGANLLSDFIEVLSG